MFPLSVLLKVDNALGSDWKATFRAIAFLLLETYVQKKKVKLFFLIFRLLFLHIFLRQFSSFSFVFCFSVSFFIPHPAVLTLIWFPQPVIMSVYLRAATCVVDCSGFAVMHFFSRWREPLIILKHIYVLKMLNVFTWNCQVRNSVCVFLFSACFYSEMTDVLGESGRCMIIKSYYDSRQWKTTSLLATTIDVASFVHPFLCHAAQYSHWIQSPGVKLCPLLDNYLASRFGASFVTVCRLYIKSQ